MEDEIKGMMAEETPNLEPGVGQPDPSVIVPVAFAPEEEAKEKKEISGFLASSVKNPWLCPNGHLMGAIVRRKKNGANLAQLYVLRLSFHSNQVVPEHFIFAIIDAGTVVCSICGEKREWRPGQDYLERLSKKNR